MSQASAKCRLFYFAISTPPVAPGYVSINLKAATKSKLTKELLDVTVDSKLPGGQAAF